MKFRLHHILWLLAFGALSVQCSDKKEVGIADTDNGKYNSYWYYSYAMVDTLTAPSLGLGAGMFNPYAVAQRGDTLLVANSTTDGKNHSLILFDLKTDKPLRTVSSWTLNGKELKFTSRINAIVVAGDRLYVDEQQSRIHVFDLPNLNYITCIGNGNWNGPVFQAQAIEVRNGLVFAREKNGRISVYKEADATTANYQKVNRYKQTNTGTPNNSFNAHYMEWDADGKLWLTDYEGKSIRVLDPSLINDDFKNGSSIDIADRAWTLEFKPRTFARVGTRLYMTGDNNALNIYDQEAKEWIDPVKSVKGFAFSLPERVFASPGIDTLWVSDTKKNTLVKVGVFKGEIREFSRINSRIIRVEEALTTKGVEREPFFVDIRTHEVVADPYKAEK